MNPLFQLGECVGTPGALQLLADNDVSYLNLLDRHVSGDWGDIEFEDDKRMNEHAVASGVDRIMSVYKVGDAKVWIITEADRSVTTVLLPEEY